MDKITVSRLQLLMLLYLMGGLGLLFGGLHLSSYLTAPTATAAADAAFNAGFGLLHLGAGWLVGRGKRLALAPVAVGMAASLIYSYAMGRGFSFIPLAVGAMLLVLIGRHARLGGLA